MRKLSRHWRLVLVHALDSAILAATAGVIVALLSPWLATAFQPVVKTLVPLGVWGNFCLAILALLSVGALCPRHLLAIVRGLRRFPIHFGLIVKVVLALGVCFGVLLATSEVDQPGAMLLCLLRLALAALLGLIAGYCCARITLGWKASQAPGRPHAVMRNTSFIGGFSTQWMVDDLPIDCEGSNLFPSHGDAAERILNRLLTRPECNSWALPSIAIMGAYGSGKTSLCNLVRDRYFQRRQAGTELPNLLFCRYEAWQYLTGEAAARGLVETATQAILAVADIPELLRLPDQYVAAMKDGGVTLPRFAASLLGSNTAPTTVLSAIGKALERLNIQLVVFVDDLDRIEEKAVQVQQAVTQAINQLQNVPNVQYVVAVGPPRAASYGGSVVTYDLLKLTRFQEIVPKPKPQRIANLLSEARNEALKDTAVYFPWAEVHEEDKDPFAWNEMFAFVMPSGPLSALAELLDTPRAIKAALRETEASWNNGLKGEINWYELLLACTLRVAEPALFEWIERDTDLFLSGPSIIERMNQNVDEKKARGEELRNAVLNSLQRSGIPRQEAVLSVIKQLFPAFASHIGDGRGGSDVPHWRQGIGYRPPSGRPYIERFLSGCLAEGEIPDQPTLQFIRHIMQNQIDKSTFQSMYLDSREKLTGSMSRFVQFSGLLSLDKALEVCNVIVEWVAEPAHARQWHTPRDYPRDMMGDVYEIIMRSDDRSLRQFLDSQRRYETRERQITSWLEANIAQYATTALALVGALLELFATPGNWNKWAGSENIVKDLWRRFACELRDAFVLGDTPLPSYFTADLLAIRRLVHALRSADDYASFRSRLTRKLVDQADNDKTNGLKASVVFSLVEYERSVTKEECVAEQYVFGVNKEANDILFDIPLIMGALRRWSGTVLPDPVAQKAFDKLLTEYKTEGTGAA